MLKGIFTLKSNENIAKDIYKMVLEGDTAAITAPGQFINIALDGFYLRRPISVCDFDSDTVTIIYKTVGRGTRYMSTLGSGARLDVLSGLGNGFDLAKGGAHPILLGGGIGNLIDRVLNGEVGEKPLPIGGGVGVPPMFRLAKELCAAGRQVSVILGFNTAADVFCADEFRALGAQVHITTADGSVGTKGFVTDAMRGMEYTYTYACGPEPMLRAVYAAAQTSGQYSFEERMGCGFGACMGCSCKTKYGNKRICKDGPVLVKEEIIW